MSVLDGVILNKVGKIEKILGEGGGGSGGGSFSREWYSFPSSEVWVVPESGEYFIFCAGGGGGAYDKPYGGRGGVGCGGGSGGTPQSPKFNGSGGGGAGTAIKVAALEKGQSITISVANGGNVGYSGGDSSVIGGGLNITCTGGGLGQYNIGGVGGTATGGDLVFSGGHGGLSDSSSFGGGGGGGILYGNHGCSDGKGVHGGNGGYGGGGFGGGFVHRDFTVHNNPNNIIPGTDGQPGMVPSWLSSIPGYAGPTGNQNSQGGVGGPGLVAIRRIK